MTLRYGDDRIYAVELNDQVECRLDGRTYGGVVTALYPRSGEVTVRYDDHADVARTTGNSRRKSRRFHVSAVDLIARDG